MTVLVSVVRKAIQRGPQGQGDRLRLHRRHLRVARGLRRGGRPAGRRAAAARQDLDRAARAAARPRRARARARHRLRRLHGDRAAARGRGHRLPRQLDEPAAHRGPEDGRDRDRAAVRLGGARLGHPAERQPRQRRRALRGLQDDEGARRHRRATRASCVAQAENANPLYRAWIAGKREVDADAGQADAGDARSRSATR